MGQIVSPSPFVGRIRLADDQAGPFNGTSLDFLPSRYTLPTKTQAKKHGWPPETLVIDEWLLLEYAFCFLSANQGPWSKAPLVGVEPPAERNQTGA